MVVVVVLGADVLHLVDAAALGAALDGALAGKLRLALAECLPLFFSPEKIAWEWDTYGEPGDDVGVDGEAGAAGELLLAGGADDDGVLHRAQAAGVEGAHVEDVDALHLTQDLETLETGGLLEVRGDGAGLGAGTEQVLLALDLCSFNHALVQPRRPSCFLPFFFWAPFPVGKEYHSLPS